MTKYILFLFIGFFSFACGNNSDGNDKKMVQEIKASAGSGMSNADIIRNPITANAPLDTTKLAKFEFEETEYEFGAVLEGAQVKHTFTFKNVGKVPLIISDARSTCGCTVPTYPKEPIEPGDSGEIQINFNTVRKLENQVKPVTITANTYPAKTVLKVKGYVKPQKTNPLIKEDKDQKTEGSN